MITHLFSVWRKRLYKACTTLSSAILCTMLVVIFVQVILRNFYGIPMPWAEEVSTYLMIALALFGSVFVMYEKGHLYVDSIITLMPGKIKILCAVVTTLLQCIFFAIIIYFCIFSLQHASNVQSMSLGISMLLPYMAIPVAFTLMFLEILFQCIELICILYRQCLGGSV